MAPPFSGSTKILEFFLKGNLDFNKPPISDFTLFSQFLMYKSLPTMMEVRPKPIAAKIFTDPLYEELGNAIRNRIKVENECQTSICLKYLIKYKIEKFEELFKGYFPSLLDKECKEDLYNSYILGNKAKCFTYIYNIGDCPTIVIQIQIC